MAGGGFWAVWGSTGGSPGGAGWAVWRGFEFCFDSDYLQLCLICIVPYYEFDVKLIVVSVTDVPKAQVDTDLGETRNPKHGMLRRTPYG